MKHGLAGGVGIVTALLCVLGVSVGSAGTQVLYVDPVFGQDSGSGSISSPLGTMGTAITMTQPGAVIVLLPGEIAEGGLRVLQPLSIVAFEPEATTWRAPNSGISSFLLEIDSDNVSVDGITFHGESAAGTGAAVSAIRMRSPLGSTQRTGIVIRDVTANGFLGDAVLLDSITDSEVIRLSVHRAGLSGAGAGLRLRGGDVSIQAPQIVESATGIAIESRASLPAVADLFLARIQDCDVAYVAMEDVQNVTVRASVFEGASLGGETFAGLGAGVVVRNLRRPGAAVLVTDCSFARTGRVFSSDTMGSDDADAPATLTVQNTNAWNIAWPSLFGTTASSGAVQVQVLNNRWQFSPGLLLERWERRADTSLRVTHNEFTGYRSLFPKVQDTGVEVHLAPHEGTVGDWNFTFNRIADFDRAFVAESTGIAAVRIGLWNQFVDNGTAVCAIGAGLRLDLFRAVFLANELAVDWRGGALFAGAPDGFGNVFLQGPGSVFAGNRSTANFSHNFYSACIRASSTDALFSTMPFELAPGLEDAAPALRFDRDADGLPDVFELSFGASPYLRDSDGDGIADGVEVRLDLNPTAPFGLFSDLDGDGIPDEFDPHPLLVDGDGDGFPDWHEIAIGTSPRDSRDTPMLGDLFENGTVDLSDAVRALQVVNGAVPLSPEYGNIHAMDVTGEESLLSLNNPLQILRFQSGSRQYLPAVTGFD